MYGPYGAKESLLWLKKYFHRPSVRRPFPASASSEFVARRHRLRKLDPAFEVVFIGDLMSLGDCRLRLGPEAAAWIESADYLVGNLEAPITPRKGYLHLKQSNHPRILETLAALKKPERCFFSLANNHSNDFGAEELQRSAQRLREGGFRIFGTVETPWEMIADRVLIYGATQWSNRSFDGLSIFDPASPPPQSDADLNLLFCHWGYEFEAFPRLEQVHMAEALLKTWDGIIGHHSHMPQPVSLVPGGAGGEVKPVAYSLGNFAIAYRKAVLNYGLMVKLSFGWKKDDGATAASPKLAIGELEWSFIHARKTSPASVEVELAPECPLSP